MRVIRTVFQVFAAVLCCAAGFTSAATAGGLKVELRNSRAALRITVRNTSGHNIKVEKDLLYGPPEVGLWNVCLEIRDIHGQEKGFVAKVNGGSWPKWRNLAPGDFVGTLVSKGMLSMEYALDKGVYEVRANYYLRSDQDDILKTYRSNTLRVELGGTANEILDQLEKSGDLFRVDLNRSRKSAPSTAVPDH